MVDIENVLGLNEQVYRFVEADDVLRYGHVLTLSSKSVLV